jgi:ribosomal protein L7/L12
MDKPNLNMMQLRARALAMALRGHFRAASERDAEVLEALASNCVSDVDELSRASAMVTVVLARYPEQRFEVIKEIRAFTGFSQKEAEEIVEAAPIAFKEPIIDSSSTSFQIEIFSPSPTLTSSSRRSKAFAPA